MSISYCITNISKIKSFVGVFAFYPATFLLTQNLPLTIHLFLFLFFHDYIQNSSCKFLCSWNGFDFFDYITGEPCRVLDLSIYCCSFNMYCHDLHFSLWLPACTWWAAHFSSISNQNGPAHFSLGSFFILQN